MAQGLKARPEGRPEHKQMVDHADQLRQGDLDIRGNLSEKALVEFTIWFLKVCVG